MNIKRGHPEVMTGSIEYQVVKRMGSVEVRRYPSIILATVRGRNDDSAFSILFDFISGNNQAAERIPMTAPVVPGRAEVKIDMTTPVLSDEATFSFVLPSHYEMRNAPRPMDRRIELVPVPSRHLAVLRFSGRAYVREVIERGRELLGVLKDRGVQVTNAPFLMRYNSPFAPGFMRRNEVAVEIDPESLTDGEGE
jgi:hypothetical protein